MKTIITESQYDSLFKQLPISLKRRMSSDDLDIIENLIWKYTYEFDDQTITNPQEFVDIVIADAMRDFIIENKFDEIDNPSDDLHYKLYDVWCELTPLIKEQYKLELTVYYLTEISKKMTMDQLEDIIKKFK
jgi:hypothetical protein